MNNILSLFDGTSTGQIVLNELGIKYHNYYASEINKNAIKVTQYHFPNTIQLGDVRNINGKSLSDIKFLIGGSPCPDLSFMGKRKGMSTVEKVEIHDLETYLNLKKNGFEFIGESYLFWEFVRLLKETNAKYFFLENVRMTNKWKNIISKALGVEPLTNKPINSSIVSAQNRERYYWTNIPNIVIPEDKGIQLSDIIPGAVACGKRGRKLKGDNFYSYPLTKRVDGKSNCVVTSASNTGMYILNDEVKKLTADDAEVLQTLDRGYTKLPGISETARYEMIGNGWTKNLIKEFFTPLKTKKNKYELFFH